MAKLKDFMISRVRVKLYKIFFDNITEMYYVRQLTRMASEEINAVRRELGRMEERGIIKSEKRGNRLYYYTDPSYDFYEDLLSLVAKTTGIGQSLRENLTKLGKIKFAMVSGKFMRRKKQPTDDDVDMLIVGEVDLDVLRNLIQEEQDRIDTEINYTIMKEDEFMFRKNRRDPFLLGILSKSRIMIIGDEEGLVDRKEAA